VSEVKVIPSRSMCLDGFIAEGFARVLDVGCGEGELARYLPDGAWVGLDNSQTMLEWAPAGAVRALPLREGARRPELYVGLLAKPGPW
jgi:SAM-dependent methyltransferase